MNFKTLPFLVLSLGLLSGCTNKCQGNPTPTTEQTSDMSTNDNTMGDATQATDVEQAAADEMTSTTDMVATAESQN